MTNPHQRAPHGLGPPSGSEVGLRLTLYEQAPRSGFKARLRQALFLLALDSEQDGKDDPHRDGLISIQAYSAHPEAHYDGRHRALVHGPTTPHHGELG